MSYSKELSSVKIMPRYFGDTSTVSGLCDEVARARADGKLDLSAFQTYSSNAITEINGTYPVVCTDNYDTTYDISMDTIPLVPGSGIDFVEQQNSLGYTSSVAINVTSCGNTFPITGANGTTGFTANMDCSSMYISTGVNTQGSVVKFNTKGVHYAAYPSTDVSASWYDIITQLNNITCSSVKLTTSYREKRFVTSSLPNLNKITFIAPSYGPYGTYSAKIDDGENTFVAEVASGCCMTVVKCWNEDRNKDCWCGLNQETYSYIG